MNGLATERPARSAHQDVARCLLDTNEQIELPVRGGEVAVLEEEELDLPEARIIDPEGVGLGPVLAFD